MLSSCWILVVTFSFENPFVEDWRGFSSPFLTETPESYQTHPHTNIFSLQRVLIWAAPSANPSPKVKPKHVHQNTEYTARLPSDFRTLVSMETHTFDFFFFFFLVFFFYSETRTSRHGAIQGVLRMPWCLASFEALSGALSQKLLSIAHLRWFLPPSATCFAGMPSQSYTHTHLISEAHVVLQDKSLCILIPLSIGLEYHWTP